MTPMPIMWDGQPISAPGLFRNIPIDQYHLQLTESPSISSSSLRTIFNDSPAHYFDTSYLNPRRAEKPESEAFRFGRACHHLLLGEADFGRHFVVRPEKINDPKEGVVKWNGNRLVCIEWLAHCRDQGLTVLTPAEIEAIRGMAAGLAAEPLVQQGILSGLIEHSFVWKDEETGVWLKWRPDAIPTDALDFADLKSAADISDDGIETAIGRDCLNMQGALGAMACRAVLGAEMTSFTLVFAEKTRPHCVRVKTLKPVDLELGERQVRSAIRAFARCLDRGRWPGPGGEQTDAEYVEIKPYHRGQIERRLAVMEQELAA